MKSFAHFRPHRSWILALGSFVMFSCGGPSDQNEESDADGSTGDADGIESVDPDDTKSGKGKSTDSEDRRIPEAVLETIRIEPEDIIVRMDLGKEQEQEFKAIGLFTDGEERDITDKVTWEVEETKLGAFDDETLVLAPQSKFAVKSTKVFARMDSRRGIGQVTLAAYQRSGDRPDFLFILPYTKKKEGESSNLRFSTDVPALDVFFNVDTTMSMEDEINQLRNSLRKTIVPQIKSKIKNTQFGVGSFEDFPVGLYGANGKVFGDRPDQPFSLKQFITDDIGKVQQGVNALSLGHGRDVPESAFESLYQIATGEGFQGPGLTRVPASTKGIGGVRFREGTMPVIVTITDAVSHVRGEADDGCKRDYTGEVGEVAHTRKQTLDALEKVCARVIYVASNGNMNEDAPHCIPETDGKALAKATGARVFPSVWNKNRPAECDPGECCTGIDGSGKKPEADGRCSLVYNVNNKGAGLGKSVVSGIEALAFYAQFDVTLEQKGEEKSIDDVPLPDGRTTLDFISSIQADKFGKPPLEGIPDPKPSGDKFKDVTPGTEVQFKINALNDFLPEKEGTVQIFRATIKVRADQCEGLELDTREVHFIIPPAPIAPPI